MKAINKITDEQIVYQIINEGNTKLFGVIYDRYAAKVYSKCLSFSKDEEAAADLAQEIFIKIYIQLNSFQNKSKLSTWIYSLASNYCIDQARKKKRSKVTEPLGFIELADEELQYAEECDEELTMDQLQVAMASIPLEDREILEMKYIHNLSLKVIQQTLGLGESAVKMRLKRAKGKILKLRKDVKAPV